MATYAQKTSLHTKVKTEPFSIPTDLIVSHLNSELGDVASKKTKLNRAPAQQRTRYYYFEKDKLNLLLVYIH